MRNPAIGVGVFLASVPCAGAAFAEPFASHGSLAVGAERVFGVDYTKTTTTQRGTGLEGTDSQTSIALLGHTGSIANVGSIGNAIAVVPGSVPRLNLDVFLGPGISLGGGIMYQHFSLSNKHPGVAASVDSSVGYYLFAPRVGFGIPINDILAIWPRWGISYQYLKLESPGTLNGTPITNKTNIGMWFTTLDALLLISPVQHVAFTVGPALDILIGGPTVTDNGVGAATDDTSMYSLGLHAGLTAWF